MAKKKVQPTPETAQIVIEPTKEALQTAHQRGHEDGGKRADELYMRLAIDKRISAKELDERIEGAHYDSCMNMMKFHELYEKNKTQRTAYEYSFWREYYTRIQIYTRRFLELSHPNFIKGIKDKKSGKSSVTNAEYLGDIFNEGKFDEFKIILETLGITQGGKLTKYYKNTATIEALYEHILGKDFLRIDSVTTFRNCSSSHYMGKTYGRSAYAEAKKRLKYRRIVKTLEGHK